MENNIIGLFPTPLYKGNFLNTVNYNKRDVLSFVDENTIERDNIGNKTFYSKNKSFILDEEMFLPVREIICEKILNFKKEVLCLSDNIEVELSSSWININNSPDDYHHIHAHPNSYLSGVFYIKTIQPDDCIHFSNPTFGNKNIYYNSDFDASVKDYNIYNSATWYIPVRDSDLIIFPSGFQHSVRQNDDCSEGNCRISLSFNTSIKGMYGHGGEIDGHKFERNDSVYWRVD